MQYQKQAEQGFSFHQKDQKNLFLKMEAVSHRDLHMPDLQPPIPKWIWACHSEIVRIVCYVQTFWQGKEILKNS